MKYKVGDTVRVKSKEWFDKQPKDAAGDVYPLNNGHAFFVLEMYDFCGSEVEITFVDGDAYLADSNEWDWEDWMLEDLTIETVKKHSIHRRKFSKIGNLIY